LKNDYLAGNLVISASLSRKTITRISGFARFAFRTNQINALIHALNKIDYYFYATKF